MSVKLIAALLVALALGAQSTEPPETVEVTLKQGRLEGVRDKIGDSRYFYSFMGIPFAAPPVGELRFRSPTPASPWNGLRKWVHPPMCAQLNLIGGTNDVLGREDCLYLNIFTPTPYASGFPVLVYIHGGAFQLGDATNMAATPRPLLKEDVVLVNIQYRLGTLGFLSTGDSTLPGNLGLRDQTFALQWVHDNINQFGGDPNKVTVFGTSAGSSSAHFQVLTPYAKGLFHQAFLQSGTALNPWTLRDDHRERALKIARSFNCPGVDASPVDTTLLRQCFMDKTTEELTQAGGMDVVGLMPFLMVPRVDGDYLPAHPAILLREGSYNMVNIVSGICQNEGGFFLLGYVATEEMRKNFLEDFDHLGPIVLARDYEDNKVYLSRRAFYHYVGSVNVTENDMDAAEKAVGDSMFNIGHDEATSLHARAATFGKKTYRYEFQHRSSHTYGEMMFPSADFAKHWIGHAEDAQYYFHRTGEMALVLKPEEVFLSDIMLKLLTNFVKTGNPTPDLELGFKWESMKSKDDFKFLSLTPGPKMKEDNRDQSREFWRNMPTNEMKALFPERFSRSCGTDTSTTTCHTARESCVCQ